MVALVFLQVAVALHLRVWPLAVVVVVVELQARLESVLRPGSLSLP